MYDISAETIRGSGKVKRDVVTPLHPLVPNQSPLFGVLNERDATRLIAPICYFGRSSPDAEAHACFVVAVIVVL
jgi:hypothetical protein